MPAVVAKNSSAAMKRPPEGLFSIVASCREGHFSSHLQRASSISLSTLPSLSFTLSISSSIESLIFWRSSGPDWGVKSIVRAEPMIMPPTSDTMAIPVFFIVAESLNSAMGLAKSGPKPYLWTHDRRFPHIRRLYRPSHLSRRGCGRPAPDGGGVVRAGFPELFERHGRGFRFGRRRGGAGTPGACARRAARRCGSVPGAGDALLPGRPRTLPARAGRGRFRRSACAGLPPGLLCRAQRFSGGQRPRPGGVVRRFARRHPLHRPPRPRPGAGGRQPLSGGSRAARPRTDALRIKKRPGGLAWSADCDKLLH